jgi:hypothetical protein
MDVREQQVTQLADRQPSTVEAGPQSKSAGPSSVSTTYTPISCSMPRKNKSIESNRSITPSSQVIP